jgi:UDP-N-acetylglucosamine 2-epimerase (non-hydrolysing)
VTGNPIFEVIQHHAPAIEASGILGELGLEAGRYFLVTLHRAENVDVESRLLSATLALDRLQRRFELPVIVSTHPRTRARSKGVASAAMRNDEVRWLPPFGFFDFVRLERDAACVLSDSGTVQEECCILRIPNVTLRDATERPETLDCGSGMLVGVEPERVLRGVEVALAAPRDWSPPREYLVPRVADAVVKILLGLSPGEARG